MTSEDADEPPRAGPSGLEVESAPLHPPDQRLGCESLRPFGPVCRNLWMSNIRSPTIGRMTQEGDPTHFADRQGRGWDLVVRELAFDQQATLSRHTAQELLHEHIEFRNAVRKVAYDPRSTREQLRELLMTDRERQLRRDAQALAQRRGAHRSHPARET